MSQDRPLIGRSLEDCPYYVVTRASLTMTSAFKKSFTAAGLGNVRPSYLVVLWCLWEQPGLKMAELARNAGLDPSTLTGLLDRMERDGFVLRAPDPEDRRALKIQLTESGAAIQRTAKNLVDKTLSMLFDGIDEQEINRTNEVLKQVMINVKGEER